MTALVAAGHREEDVLWEYSYGELEIFYSALAKEKREELKRQAVAARVGMNADKKGFKRFLDDSGAGKKVDRGDAEDLRSLKSALQEKMKTGSRILRMPPSPERD